MENSLACSILLHTALFVLVVFGLPSILPQKQWEPQAISVELLPISEISNVKPSQKPVSKKPPKPAPQKNKPVPKTTTQEKKSEPKKPVEKVKLPEPKKDEKKPPEKKKEKPKVTPKDEPDDLEAVLKSVEKTAQSSEDETKKKPKEASDSSKSASDNYTPTIPLSLSEKDAIRSQFVRCWRMPAGARNAHELAVVVRVLLFPDGSVQDAGLVPDQVSRYSRDPFFRAAADAAIRAVWQCNPITGLPPEKFDSWKDMELNFDPRELLY